MIAIEKVNNREKNIKKNQYLLMKFDFIYCVFGDRNMVDFIE
jgi:hypothetical protein